MLENPAVDGPPGDGADFPTLREVDGPRAPEPRGAPATTAVERSPHVAPQAMLTESLRSTRTVEEVADTLAAFSAAALDVAWGGILLHEHKRGRLRRVDGRQAAPVPHDWAAFTASTSGPAAAAIARRRMVVFDDAAALLADFPEVETWGPPPAGGTVAFVPLLLPRGALGSAVLWWSGVRPLTRIDGARLTGLARSLAAAIDRIEAAAEQRADAEMLQRSLLTRLPRPDGLELHARYVPAGRGREIGGDWYDGVILSDGATAVMIGDVTGHDMAAATQMAQLRGLLRGFAYDRDEPPAAIIHRLERACVGLDITTLATLVLARLEHTPNPDGSTHMTWTNAGHPPPVLLHTDGRTDLLEAAPEAMLSLTPDPTRTNHEYDLPPGTTLLLYTDGLVERRDRDVRTGVEHLRKVLPHLRRLPLPTMLDVVVSQLAGGQPEDDVAVLAVRSRWAPPPGR